MKAKKQKKQNLNDSDRIVRVCGSVIGGIVVGGYICAFAGINFWVGIVVGILVGLAASWEN